jgi:nucleoside-specific outer membrane channel protein Tsx
MGDNKRNAYEIRESLLGMAIGILSDRDSRLRENEYLKPEGNRQPVEGYDVDEVIKIANKLDSFVSQS